MAHNLNFNQQTGSYSFFSVKEKAWHGLGKIIQDYPTSKEAIIQAGLDYNVTKSPLFTIGSGLTVGQGGEMEISQNSIAVPDYYATIRTDNNTVLGVVGKDYEVVQNADAFSFFDAIVGGGDGILYETAGALGLGERIFITAKLPDYIKVGSNDMIEKYIFLTTSHDGSGSITAAFTPIRIVCQNTLNAALRNSSNTIRIRHTANAKQRLDEAHKVLGLSNKLTGQFEGIFNQWAKVRISDSEVKKLIQMAMAPNKETLNNLIAGKDELLSTLYKNTVEDVFAYAMTSDTQQMETTKGTVYGAYNAVTGYFQNVRNYSDDQAKVKSLLMGGTAQLRNQSAFNLCTDFAKDGADIFMFN
jgi:phage/plasmid-like protein (TIGR03299 family)